MPVMLSRIFRISVYDFSMKVGRLAGLFAIWVICRETFFETISG